MALEFTSTTVELICLGLFLATLSLIFGMKYYLWKQSQKPLSEKYKNHQWASPLEGRTKYPELDSFAYRGSFLIYGLAIAMSMAILVMSWTIHDERSNIEIAFGEFSDDIEVETPRTMEPPPPPPPPPTALSVVANELPNIETVIFEDQSITEDTYVDAPVAELKKAIAPPPPPPPPPPVEKEEDEIFRIVEEHPSFPGCEDVGDKDERKICAEQKLMEYMAKNIKYPAIARQNSIEGMVVVQFVVEKDGSITNVKILRDIGGRCGEEAVRVVKEMPTWNPGKQRGRPVRVQFVLPVRFMFA